MTLRPGDRVRIRNPTSEYTGCRGTITDDPSQRARGVEPLGHWVAIDGENGRSRPFLLSELEPLRPARVRPRAVDPSRRELGGTGPSEGE